MGADLSQRITDWMILISLAAGTLLVLARFIDRSRVLELLQFPWDGQSEEFSLRFNSGKVKLNADRLLILAAWLLFPLLIVALKMAGRSEAILLYDWASFFRIFLLSGLYLVLKLLLASAIGYAFEREEASLQSQNLALAHFTWIALIGGFFAFLTFFLPLAKLQFYLVLFLVLIIAVIFLFRNVYYSIKMGFSLSYIILYLCALEIIPLMFLYSLV